MTDDTLREECETLLDSLDATYPDVMLGGTLADVGTKYKADIAKLLAFARVQQAKGRVQAVKAVELYKIPSGHSQEGDAINVYLDGIIRDILEAQATAREQHT